MQDPIDLLLGGQQFRQLYEKEFSHIMERYSLRKVEIDVIYMLERNGGEDTATHLAKTIRISKAHISKAVENLQKLNLIMIIADEHDHRCSRLRMKKESKKLVYEIMRIHERIHSIVFTGLSNEEIDCFRKLSVKIIENMECSK